MGYSKEQFVDKIASQFVCSICQDVVQQPLQCSQCESLFCNECIKSWLSSQKQQHCPNCRKIEPSLLPPVKIVLGILNDYKIRCQICSFVTTLERLQIHQQSECIQRNQYEACLIKVQQLEEENKALKQELLSQKDQNSQLIEVSKQLEQKCNELQEQLSKISKNQIEGSTNGMSPSIQSSKSQVSSKSISIFSNQNKEYNCTTKINQGIEYTLVGQLDQNGLQGFGLRKSKQCAIVGFFQNDKLQGKGVWLSPDGDWYFGQWQNDLFNGDGIYQFHNGMRYEGEFKNSKKNGYGIMYKRDGRFVEANWENDNIIKRF